MSRSPERPKSSPRAPSEPALPAAATSGIDHRLVDAWCAWLGTLATNAEAALAAAMAYKELDGADRDTWLAALEHDAKRVDVPLVAVYAPLLAVESDPERRARITAAIGPTEGLALSCAPHAFGGVAADGVRVATIVSPLYLEFVRVLACGYRIGHGFEWVRHDPIVDREHAPRSRDLVGGATMEATPISPLVDELAHVVLAHQRSGRGLPEALRVFADLFEPAPTLPSLPL